MNKNKLNLIFILVVVIAKLSYGQTLSKQVTDYIAIQDSIVLIKNVTLIDGSGGEVKYNQDILLVDDRIVAIGQSHELDTTEKTSVIDGTGKTVIPGLIMMHEHLFHAKPFYGSYKIVQMAHTFPQMYLAGGVTTMRTAGGFEVNADLNIKNLIETGFTMEESIKISTLNGAEYLGIDDETGTVEAGKRADLVLIDGDLSKDVSAIRNMEIVFKNGIGYDSRKIFDSVKGKVGAY